MRYFLILCAAVLMTSCAPRVFQTAGIETLAKKHTTIAIIQPTVDYRFERPDHRNWRFVPAKEEIAAGIQLALKDWIKDQQDRGQLDIKVLDIETTNEIMAGADIADRGKLAQKLGVDAVLFSRFRYDSRADYASEWLLNDQLPQSRIYLNLFTAGEGLIWSYEHGGTQFNNYERTVSDLLWNAENHMPYGVAK